MLSSRIGWKSLSLTCRSLATMLHSGIDLRKAIGVAARRTGDRRCQRALEAIATDIAKGEDLASALRNRGDAFPQLMIDMVAVAEQSGALPEVLFGLADHYENNLRLRKAFLGQIAWPVFQLVAAILIIAFVMLILGWIAESRNNAPVDILGLGMIGERGALLWLGMTFGSAFVIFVAYQVATRALGGKQVFDPMFMQVPVVAHCMRSFAIARFTWAYYLTAQTGMPISQCLAASLRATANGAFTAAIPFVCGAVNAGEDLSEALAKSKLFPEDFLHMVSVAESSGTVPEALQRLSPQFEDQARRSLSALTAIAAWLIWALVAAFIVFIIFRIFSFYVGMINEAAKGI